MDDLIPLLLAQDRSAAFRHILAQTNEAAAAAAGILPADGPDASAAATGAARGPQVLMSKSGVRLVVFVASNDVTQLAVNLVLMMARWDAEAGRHVGTSILATLGGLGGLLHPEECGFLERTYMPPPSEVVGSVTAPLRLSLNADPLAYPVPAPCLPCLSYLARPGRDVVHLVTVVHNSLQLTQGQQLVLKYLKQVGTEASQEGCVTHPLAGVQ